MNDHNYEESFKEKWLNLFDKNRTGTIRLEEYCDTLGLESKKVLAQHQAQQKAAGKLSPDVEIISVDMTTDDQIQVVDFVKEGLRKFENEKDVSKFVKQELDKWGERMWHTVIVQGQYWSYYSYEPGKNFVFRIGKHIFLVWRTPCY